MSIQNAMDFIKKVDNDSAFRKSFYKVKGVDGFNEFLEQNDLVFNEGELEEAKNLLHVKCQFEEEADRLFNVLNLIKLTIA